MTHKILLLGFLSFGFPIQSCSASDISSISSGQSNCWASNNSEQKKINKLLPSYQRANFLISYKPKGSIDKSLVDTPIECVKIGISQEHKVEVLGSDNPILNRYAILKSQKLLKEEPKAKGIVIFYFLNSRLKDSGLGRRLLSE